MSNPAALTALTDIPVARPSSTVVLCRDSETGPELFMVQRHARSSFGTAFAFPGGVLEDEDRDVYGFCAGLDAAAADELLGVDNALDYFSSAVRELFEETGVLLADISSATAQLDDARRRLNDGALGWRRFVEDAQLSLRCDDLFYFSFWVTPTTMRKRYSTRFFLAQMPAGQEATHCGGELTDSVWISPKEALHASKDGKMVLHFPTLSTIKNLSQHDSVAAMKDWCGARQRAGISRIQPEIVDGRPAIR